MIPLPGLHNYSDSFALLHVQLYGHDMEFDWVTVYKDYFSADSVVIHNSKTHILATNSWTAAEHS